MAIFDEKIEIRERCKGVHCVDLGESFPTRIYLQKSASIQPRTSPSKFGGKYSILFNRVLICYSLLQDGSSGKQPSSSMMQLGSWTRNTWYSKQSSQIFDSHTLKANWLTLAVRIVFNCNETALAVRNFDRCASIIAHAGPCASTAPSA